MSERAVWTVHRHCRLFWRDWGGDSVVFEARSGHTHQFAPLAAAVMAHLEERACSLEQLVGAIATDLEAEVDADLRARVDCIVAEFARLGWIEASSSP